MVSVVKEVGAELLSFPVTLEDIWGSLMGLVQVGIGLELREAEIGWGTTIGVEREPGKV